MAVESRALILAWPDASRDDLVASLFDRHYVGLCRLAYLLLGETVGAEDVVQEAFLRTFSGWRRLRDHDRADAYLRRSVVNLCRSRLRRRSVEDRGNAACYKSDERGQRGWDADRHDTGLAVVEAVRRLPPRQRMTVVLRYYEDMAEAEVADLMDCSVGTVKSQLAKARTTLASALAADRSEIQEETNP